jgi:hypothetical protein
MRRTVLAGLTALALVLLAATIVKAKCPEGCKTGVSAAMTDNGQGCHNPDPNSK